MTRALSVADPYEQLRDAIVSGRLQPNERLVEADLTDSLGAGRSAVRTALARLAQEGLIEHTRNRGARVRMIGEVEAVEILEARTVLEALAARRAAEWAPSGRRRPVRPAGGDAPRGWTQATRSAPLTTTRCCTGGCSTSPATRSSTASSGR